MLDLKRQYESIKDDVADAVERVLTTQHFIGGPELDGFERESAAYLGVRANVGCASGTDALWLALAAAGVQPGDRVITSAFTFFASGSSITRCGATPLFVDIDPATLNLDMAAVEKLLGDPHPVRAIMPVHLYGQCADMDALAALARAAWHRASLKMPRRRSAPVGAGRKPARWDRRLHSVFILRRT